MENAMSMLCGVTVSAALALVPFVLVPLALYWRERRRLDRSVDAIADTYCPECHANGACARHPAYREPPSV
jgi:hypothetical protein